MYSLAAIRLLAPCPLRGHCKIPIYDLFCKVTDRYREDHSFSRAVVFDGCAKDSWSDNQEAIDAAISSSGVKRRGG